MTTDQEPTDAPGGELEDAAIARVWLDDSAACATCEIHLEEGEPAVRVKDVGTICCLCAIESGEAELVAAANAA